MSDKKTSLSMNNKTDGSNKLVEKYLNEVDDDEDSADDEESSVATSAQSLGVRAQKKFLSKFSSKSVAKVFIDEASCRVLDNLQKLIRNYSGSKKEAEKLLKGIIKTIVKIGILYKNDVFNDQELKFIEQFRNRFHSFSRAIVTFYEVDFTVDCLFLSRLCDECRDLTHKIIATHLTNKSHARVDYVFNTVSNIKFLEYSFDSSSETNRAIIREIAQDLNALMDAGLL